MSDLYPVIRLAPPWLMVGWRARDLALAAFTNQAATYDRADAVACAGGLDASGKYFSAVPKQPRFAYANGNLGLLLEGARTNRCLFSWGLSFSVSTDVDFPSGSVISPAGVVGAFTIVATGANGHVIKDLGVLSSTKSFGAVWLQRMTGSGPIQLTLDGGSTWTTVPVTALWSRPFVSQTLANPDFGVRLVTAGDAVHCWQWHAEDGPFLGSDIRTDDVALTRAADSLAWEFGARPQASSYYDKYVVSSPNNTAADYLDPLVVGGTTLASNDCIFMAAERTGDSSAFIASVRIGGSTVATAEVAGTYAPGDVIERLLTVSELGVLQLSMRKNGGTITQGAASAAGGLPLSFTAAQLAATTAANPRFGHLVSVGAGLGVCTMDALARALG